MQFNFTDRRPLNSWRTSAVAPLITSDTAASAPTGSDDVSCSFVRPTGFCCTIHPLLTFLQETQSTHIVIKNIVKLTLNACYMFENGRLFNLPWMHNIAYAMHMVHMWLELNIFNLRINDTHMGGLEGMFIVCVNEVAIYMPRLLLLYLYIL